MQRIPFQRGWAFAREPGLPIEEDDDSSSTVEFEEAPASPDPSSGDTSVYAITPSIETPGPPTPPPSADPHLHIGDLVRAAVQRLQEAAPAAAVDAAPNAAPEAAATTASTPPATPLRRSARIAARAHPIEEAPVRPAEEAPVQPLPRRGPQRVAKMSTGGVRKQ